MRICSCTNNIVANDGFVSRAVGGSISAFFVYVRRQRRRTATTVNTVLFSTTTRLQPNHTTTYPTGATHSTVPVHSRTPHSIARMLTTSHRTLPCWQATIILSSASRGQPSTACCWTESSPTVSLTQAFPRLIHYLCPVRVPTVNQLS